MGDRLLVIFGLAFWLAFAASASGQQQGLIVRDSQGQSQLVSLCTNAGCTVVRSLGDPQQQVFLVNPVNISAATLLQNLQGLPGIVDAEIDQVVSLESPALSVIPDGLYDTLPVNYYGANVWDGYVNQPANLIVRTLDTQNHFHVAGSGVVAMIDTGLDPQHPALKPVVLQGYDFTRNQKGADEKGDLDHSTAAVLDGGGSELPLQVSPSFAAVVTAAGATALASNPNYADFGHGTMTAGIVHMVAPKAKILPLKAFSSNGTGYLSNIVRAVYFAAAQHSNVLSMSFNFYSYSTELANAINYASGRGIICVASAGNDGEQIVVYPASLPKVMGIAATTDSDTRSSYSNYGSQVVWVAAPGDNIVSTYPYNTYGSSSGTSFSAPFVSGTAALLLNVNPKENQSSAATAIANAVPLTPDLNHGRLDTYQAVESLEN
jgi:subtilisin family serine protease